MEKRTLLKRCRHFKNGNSPNTEIAESVKEILETEVTKRASERKYFDVFVAVEHLFT
jgi:hypothetical protein